MIAPATTTRHDALAALFAEALALPSEQREAFLDRCDEDHSAREEVRSLLRYHDSAHAPHLSGDMLRSWLLAEPAEVHPGDTIGPYVIGRLLGRGGGGAVYAARQTGALERDVALKVLDLPEPMTEPGRFAAERNAMAMLNHPHIAQVFDAAVDEQGRAFIAIEYVEGEPVTGWARRCLPSIEQIVGVFLQAADALQYAHGRGVIHRDVKPSNLLVIGGCDDARAKVIDFGLVTAAADSTLWRWLGRGMQGGVGVAGTPSYMPPEQTAADAVADVRSDVYGLGASLHTVLAGQPPIDLSDLDDAPVTALLEAVRTRPRISMRQAYPRVPADLAAICDKSMSASRYESIATFAADLQRFLGGLPVEARVPTFGYRAKRFLWRNAIPVSVAVVVVMLLVSGLIGTSSGFIRARAENERFRQQLEGNEAVNRFLADDLLGAAVPGQEGRDVRVVDLLDRATASLADRFADQPMVEADLRLTLGETYLRLGQFTESERVLQAALALLDAHAGRADPQRARALTSLGMTAVQQGRLDEAQGHLEAALKTGATGVAARRTFATAHATLADLCSQRGQWDQALRHIDAAMILLDTLFAEGNGPALLMAETLNMRALVLDEANNPEAAAALEALPRQIAELLGPDHLYAAAASFNAASALLDQSRHAEALPFMEQALPVFQREFGEKHPQTLIVMGNLASALGNSGHSNRALEMAETLAQWTPEVHGPDSVESAKNHHRLAAMLLASDRPRDALAPAQRAVEIVAKALGESHWMTGQFTSTRGLAHLKRDELTSAREDLMKGRTILAAALGDDHTRVKTVDSHLAEIQDR